MGMWAQSIRPSVFSITRSIANTYIAYGRRVSASDAYTNDVQIVDGKSNRKAIVIALATGALVIFVALRRRRCAAITLRRRNTMLVAGINDVRVFGKICMNKAPKAPSNGGSAAFPSKAANPRCTKSKVLLMW